MHIIITHYFKIRHGCDFISLMIGLLLGSFVSIHLISSLQSLAVFFEFEELGFGNISLYLICSTKSLEFSE